MQYNFEINSLADKDLFLLLEAYFTRILRMHPSWITRWFVIVGAFEFGTVTQLLYWDVLSFVIVSKNLILKTFKNPTSHTQQI